MTTDILIVSEHKEEEFDNVTFELIQKGRELADRLNSRLKVLVLGFGISGLVAELSNKGADVVLAADDSRLYPYIPEVHTQVVCDVIKTVEPAILLLGHTYRGIEMAPAIATRFNVAYASNCLNCELQDGEFFAIRPVLESTLLVRVQLNGPRPWIASIQKGSVAIQKCETAVAEVVPVKVEIAEEDIRTRTVGFTSLPAGDIDISKADILVSVGRGIQSEEGLQAAEDLAKALGGVVACSRPVADIGWLPLDRYVGVSGKTVRPRVYLACGISGANQHTVGMMDSQLIIAINKDIRAPIFRVAHYGVVGDLFEIMPVLTQESSR